MNNENGKFYVKDVDAKLNNGFAPIEFVNRPYSIITTSNKDKESWVIVAVEMPDGWKPEGKDVIVPVVTMPLPVSTLKLAEGETCFKKVKDGDLQVVSDGLRLSCDLDRNLRFTKAA